MGDPTTPEWKRRFRIRGLIVALAFVVFGLLLLAFGLTEPANSIGIIGFGALATGVALSSLSSLSRGPTEAHVVVSLPSYLLFCGATVVVVVTSFLLDIPWMSFVAGPLLAFAWLALEAHINRLHRRRVA
jgi:HAMP domain-containing protein